MESVGELKLDLKFYQGKRVFVTGHTGFKGMWLCKVLEFFGAEVTGYALPAPTAEGEKALQASGVLDNMHAVIGDVRDFSSKCGQDTPTSKVGEECPLHLTFLKTINI